MKNHKLVNELAMRVQKGDALFNDLFLMVEPEFKYIVEDYMIRNNLTGFNFDKADYISVVGQALWECIEGYDIEKGDFMPRLVLFSRKRMKDITDKNLAFRRFDKSRQVVSYEELFESEEFDLEGAEMEINETSKIISEFIKTDREGTVIAILLSTNSKQGRHDALEKFYGGFTPSTRKKVQRVRERLQNKLANQGIHI